MYAIQMLKTPHFRTSSDTSSNLNFDHLSSFNMAYLKYFSSTRITFKNLLYAVVGYFSFRNISIRCFVNGIPPFDSIRNFDNLILIILNVWNLEKVLKNVVENISSRSDILPQFTF